MVRLLCDFLVVLLLLLPLQTMTTEGDAVAISVHQNDTVGSSSSPWLKKVTGHCGRGRVRGCRKRPGICRRGEHPPVAQMRCCRNQCVDVSSDIDNCGFCETRCPFTWRCCSGLCVDTNIDPFNCGKCGKRCPWGSPCLYGMCGYAEPTPPWPFPMPPRLPFHGPALADRLVPARPPPRHCLENELRSLSFVEHKCSW